MTLTPGQLAKLRADIARKVDYLQRLLDRMERRQFPTQDEMRVKAIRARRAMEHPPPRHPDPCVCAHIGSQRNYPQLKLAGGRKERDKRETAKRRLPAGRRRRPRARRSPRRKPSPP
jgi:hypothetical protein